VLILRYQSCAFPAGDGRCNYQEGNRKKKEEVVLGSRMILRRMHGSMLNAESRDILPLHPFTLLPYIAITSSIPLLDHDGATLSISMECEDVKVTLIISPCSPRVQGYIVRQAANGLGETLSGLVLGLS
jgi:hypothetical protein